MSEEIWGQPPIPPPPESKGDLITRFDAWVGSQATSPKGFYTITLGVPPTELFKIMRAVQAKGLLLHWEVYMRTDEGDVGLDELSDELLAALELDD